MGSLPHTIIVGRGVYLGEDDGLIYIYLKIFLEFRPHAPSTQLYLFTDPHDYLPIAPWLYTGTGCL